MFIIFRALFIVLILCSITGCAIVIDNGRYDKVQENDKSVCSTNENVQFYIDNLEYRHTLWKSKGGSYAIDRYRDLVKERFENSNCFKSVNWTQVRLSKPPENTTYVELNSYKETNGFIPFFTPIIGIVFPMSYEEDRVLKAKVFNGENVYDYEVKDTFTVGNWSLFILAVPFVDSIPQFGLRKDKDMVDAFLLQMKNDDVLKTKDDLLLSAPLASARADQVKPRD